MKKEVINITDQTERIENAIGIVMRIGVCVAAAIMIIGLIMLFVKHDASFDVNQMSIGYLISKIKVFDPCAIMMLGIFALILTPVLRVVSTIFLFAHEKDKLYTAITIFVFVIIITSFVIGANI